MMSSNGFVGLAERVFPSAAEDVYGRPSNKLDHGENSVQSSVSRGESEPLIPPDSPGSSVSTRLQTEYEELLKYAIVVPTYTGANMARTMLDTRPPVTLTKTQSTAAQTGQSPPENKEDKPDEETDLKKLDRVSSVGDSSEDQRDFFHQPWPTGTANTDFHDDRDAESGSSDIFFGRTEEERLQTEGGAFTYAATIDQDVGRMNNLMEQWLADLKKNVMAEFSQSKIRMLEHHRQQMIIARDRHNNEVSQLQNEIESMKELLHNYEQSIERKDQVINNLTNGIQRHQEKLDKQKGFTEWKIKFNDAKREGFASNLAKKHYERTLVQKVWDGWHSLIEYRWRQRVEKACQAKAQEVCISLTNDYETKLASLNEALDQARTEVQRLHEERDQYEETMKKAFMRGVCALNLEAMTMFQEGDRGTQTRSSQQNANQGDGDSGSDVPSGYSATIQQEPVYFSEPPGAPLGRVVTSQTRPSTQLSAQMKDASKSRGVGAKVISAKLTARTDQVRSGASVGTGGIGLAPPMSSVVVERHQPITKQTIGQATASKYVWTGAGQQQQTVLQRKIAGQGSGFPSTTPNIQTVKVVD